MRDAEPIALTREWREVTGNQNWISFTGTSQKADHALLGVAAFNPLKAIRVKVAFIERGSERYSRFRSATHFWIPA